MTGGHPAFELTHHIALQYQLAVSFYINEEIRRCARQVVDSNGATMEFQIGLATAMKIQPLGDHTAIEHRKLCPHSALDAKLKPTTGAKIDCPRIRNAGLSIRMAAKNHTGGSQRPVVLNSVDSQRSQAPTKVDHTVICQR